MRHPYSARARPGYFSIRLNNSVTAEMTATHHAALYRFTFPHDDPRRVQPSSSTPLTSGGPLLLVDLQDQDASRKGGGGVAVDARTGRITGEGEFRPSFGTGKYAAYFCADVKGAKIRRSGTFMGDVPDATRHVLENAADGSFRVPTGSAGGWVQFEELAAGSTGIMARVGVSFVSRERACQHAEREISGFDFEGTVKKAEAAWREKLSVVSLDGAEADVEPGLLVTFWSGLYRTMLSPQDYTGENTLWESKEPYFDS